MIINDETDPMLDCRQACNGFSVNLNKHGGASYLPQGFRVQAGVVSMTSLDLTVCEARM